MHGWFWRVALASALVSVLVVPGCLGPDAEDEDGSSLDDGDAGLSPWTVEGSVSDCPESIGVLLMEPAELQALLPENFTMRDAGEFFGLGLETGRGVLFFNSVECSTGASAEVAVYVHAPQVEGFEAAEFDFYSLGYASDDGGLVENLTRVGMPAENLTASALADAVSPLTATGSADVQGSSGMVYSFEGAGSAPQPFAFTARFWHVVPSGLVLWQYELAGRDAFAGVLSSCSFPSGSLMAQIVGQGDCMGLESASLLFPEQVFGYEVRFLPGARAEQ